MRKHHCRNTEVTCFHIWPVWNTWSVFYIEHLNLMNCISIVCLLIALYWELQCMSLFFCMGTPQFSTDTQPPHLRGAPVQRENISSRKTWLLGRSSNWTTSIIQKHEKKYFLLHWKWILPVRSKIKILTQSKIHQEKQKKRQNLDHSKLH